MTELFECRRCRICDRILVRRVGDESHERFAKRITCGRVCMAEWLSRRNTIHPPKEAGYQPTRALRCPESEQLERYAFTNNVSVREYGSVRDRPETLVKRVSALA